MAAVMETPRLLLRQFTITDAQEMYLLNLNPEVIRYTGDGPFASIEAARSFLAAYDVYERFGMGRWAVIRKEDRKWLGWAGLKYHPDKEEVDLGYRFFQQYWGQGYATESGKACLEHGFTNLNLKEIVAHAMKANFASLRVLEKLGFSNWSLHAIGGVEELHGVLKNPYFRST